MKEPLKTKRFKVENTKKVIFTVVLKFCEFLLNPSGGGCLLLSTSQVDGDGGRGWLFTFLPQDPRFISARFQEYYLQC